ncbi:MAG TPA: hypothetical protein VIR16_10325 [Candidatus Limnocylindrales bacterium]
MASTDTRSGFRLPWSSDRTQDDTAVQDALDDAPVSADAPQKPSLAWPETDFTSRTGVAAARQRPADAPEPAQEAPTMITEQPPAAPPKKPTKLMADLAAAIRATTEAARDQRLGQLETEATGIVEMIRAQSDEGAVALRRRSDEDVAAIRDWAKAEIARIKEESEGRIADRKHLLEREVADHAAAIEDRVSEVHSTIAGYRRAMDEYFERLQNEDDPARLATMAETLPDPPALDGLTDLADMTIEGAAARHTQIAQAEVEVEAAPAVDAEGEAEAAGEFAEPGDEIVVTEDRIAKALGAFDGAAVGDAEPDADIENSVLVDAEGQVQGSDGVPQWTAGETPEGFPEAEGGDPVDRGAIMAALEAAAEAVVAAEAAAESAETAEAAADVAETAAELLSGRAGQMDEADPEAQAALSARVDAGGFDTESYQDRLASLLPGHAEGSADDEPRTTQVVVSGLVSVASIASFKRHLGRLGGVTGVAVASGPDGEFIFNVNHRPDVSFRDAIPTMPGFAARVVATGDGVVSVTAHDPEAES